LEKAAAEAGWRGGRDYLRNAFKDIQRRAGVQVKRGRPNNPSK
jgi:hypothetical protein